ncbi:MAG: 50S ribosomal protein L9 [Candidatus Omnitrophica bacterium]|nr:50S ribosomal protein L9 [Candidatus Omnitrophota bacterium]
MEIILLKDVNKVGRKGEVVRVREGFARNFLLPQNAAIACTKAGQKFIDQQKAQAAKRVAKEKAEAEKFAAKLEKLELKIEAPCGEQEKLYGSVTAEDISAALQEKGFELDRKKIQLKDSIRSLGAFEVSVEVYPQVKASLKIQVVSKS